jgi:6-phosphogluconolactonase
VSGESQPRARAEIKVLDDPGAEAVVVLARHAAAGHHIALTGGSTPRGAYERVAGMHLDWSRTTLWWGDERCVPPEDERSNYRLAKATLIDAIRDGPPVVHRIRGELGPAAGADDYEEQLREAFGDGVPALDLVLLGLGPDGHLASLFPGQPALAETRRRVVGVEEAGLEPFVPRVTLTLPVINAGAEVLFLVAGADKAEAVARAFAEAPDPDTPASLVSPESGSLTVLLDPPAAERLEGAATP